MPGGKVNIPHTRPHLKPDPLRHDRWGVAVQRSAALPALGRSLTGILAAELRQLAGLLGPELGRLQKQLRRRWQSIGFDPKQRKALASVTSLAALEALGEGRFPESFFEQVDYHGRRLAKLDVAAPQAAREIQEAGRLIRRSLARSSAGQVHELDAARRQLDLATLLVLHHAYYQVREAEAEAFQELFRAELEARSHRELIARCLAILRQWSRAEAARLYLKEEGRTPGWALAGCWPAVERDSPELSGGIWERRLRQPRLILAGARGWELVLAPAWRDLYATCWSVPLLGEPGLQGVLQLAFAKRYEWLPRELRVLRLAAERILAASQKARMAEDLAAREEQIRALSEQMVHLEEAERRRISEELHDEAGQSLLCLRLRLEMLEQRAMGRDNEMRVALGEARRMVEHTVEEIRRVVADLSPAVLEHLGLEAAVRRLAARFQRTHGIKVHARIQTGPEVPKRLERVVYRLVQECLNNAGKHSRASRLNLCLQSDDKGVRLRVEDDGVGFDAAKAPAGSRGFGLAGMQKRVELLGGRWQLESAPGEGTRIVIELPAPELAGEPRRFRPR